MLIPNEIKEKILYCNTVQYYSWNFLTTTQLRRITGRYTNHAELEFDSHMDINAITVNIRCVLNAYVMEIFYLRTVHNCLL